MNRVRGRFGNEAEAKIVPTMMASRGELYSSASRAFAAPQQEEDASWSGMTRKLTNPVD